MISAVNLRPPERAIADAEELSGFGMSLVGDPVNGVKWLVG